MKQGILKIVIIGMVGLSQTVAAESFTDEDINKSFYPYNNWTPTADGYTPGMVIDQSNADQFQAILDEALFRFVKDGWVTLRTAPTTDFPLSDDYIEATRQHAGDVSLAENGTLNNFVAGRAYPQEPQSDDPQAGQKLVWNYQYGFNSGDRTGKVERQLKFEWHFLNFNHRVTFDPRPAYEENPGLIYRGIYGIVKEPFDLANTQILIHRYQDDTKRDNAWLYVGFQRRVRRLAAGQITDAFLGSDLMIEDFEGYNGKVTDYTWEYAGTRPHRTGTGRRTQERPGRIQVHRCRRPGKLFPQGDLSITQELYPDWQAQKPKPPDRQTGHQPGCTNDGHGLTGHL